MIRSLSFSAVISTLLLVGLVSLGVSKMVQPLSPEDRQQLWKQVEQAKSEGLPKTAVKHLQAIYESAVADKEFVEATRAYCAIAKTEGEINQPMQPYIIRKLQADVPEMPAGMKPVMQAIQAAILLRKHIPPKGKGKSFPANSCHISHSSHSTSRVSSNVKIDSCIKTPASTTPSITACSISKKFIYVILASGYFILNKSAFVVYFPLSATLKFLFKTFPFCFTIFGP